MNPLDAAAAPGSIPWPAITHVLLDIEGTTCPVSYVARTLFPYAASHLAAFLEARSEEPAVYEQVRAVLEAWREDADPTAAQLRSETMAGTPPGKAIVPYLQWLIRQDRKLTPLKELQGMVWEQGYASGELVGPLFDDVPLALRKWQEQGLVLGVYSSGSVKAQQLIYRYSNGGDLTPLFSHWFDTRIGTKNQQESYRAISAAMNTEPHSILFASDSPAELEAAQSAGLAVVFSDRPGNPAPSPGSFPAIRSLLEIATRD